MLLERREFLKIALAAGGGVLLLNHPLAKALAPDISIVPESLSNPETQLITFDVFGIHGTPLLGGVEDDLDDAKALGAKYIVALNPSENFLEKANSLNIKIISRWWSKDNRLASDFEKNVKLYKKYQSNPIQIFNEVNLLSETKDIHRTPEKHVIEDLLPALEILASNNAQGILTPLAQGKTEKFGMEEIPYLERMLISLKEKSNPEFLKEYLTIGVHAYDFLDGEDPNKRIRQVGLTAYNILGFHLPIYITESGIYQYGDADLDENIVAEKTLYALQNPLPENPKIESKCEWLLSNLARRPKAHWNDKEAQKIESAAWVTPYGKKRVYNEVRNFAEIVQAA